MPLLRKRSFEKATAPEFLRDDEEVFYCEITNEIFRNYEEFAERMLLCTSMVWTCAMTGKSNLTYEEALESEENAKTTIREFPVELKIPILYVASKTKRTGFGEMAEDVFLYCKDRYFIGEKLETSFTANKWVDSHVLQVIVPNPEDIKKSPKNGATDKQVNPTASLYKYEVEHPDADDEDISAIMIVDFNQIRRKKASFNREKCKLFLKQYVEQDSKGHWIIKPSAMKEFAIENMSFDKIFSGPEPVFDSSKRFEKIHDKKPTPVKGKKSRQETLSKYLTKVNGTAKVNGTVENDNSSIKNSVLLEQMEKRKEEFEKIRQQKEEEKLAQKERQRKAAVMMTSQLKKWYKAKEDLELEDQQPLPKYPVIKTKIPSKYIGEVFMFMEFIKTFEKFLKSRNFFQLGVTFDIMERALLEQEVAGPLIDLIQMFLTALFREQEEETSEYSIQLAKATFLHKIDINNMSLEEAAKFATLSARWLKERQGVSIRNLPLYSLTVSEVLRIHLLSSGAKLQESGERGRFTQRGGYSCTDDPGLHLRVNKPHILKELAVKNVVQLKLKHKLDILNCLMFQLLTYADIRDTIEDRIEKNRQMKLELRNALTSEKKRENEHNTAKYHLKKEAKTNKQDPKITAESIQKLDEAEERRKLYSEKQIETFKKSAYEKETFLGMDRAFRKYYKLESLPGLFIEIAEDYPGTCLQEPVKQIPELVGCEKPAIMSYIRKNMDKLNNSDKENSPIKNSPKKMNGTATPDNSNEDNYADLLMCSGNEETCVVHSSKKRESTWSFIPHTDMLESVIKTLNNRGIREQELSQALQYDKETLLKFIRQTPIQQLNCELDIIQEEELKLRVATRAKKNYTDANFGFPAGTSIEEILQSTLTDDILELEEKIYSGSLGQLHVKDREAWRDTLLNKDYSNFNRDIKRRVYIENEKKMEVDEEEDVSTEIKSKYGSYDPGTFLGQPRACDSEDEAVNEDSKETVDSQTAVECLAIALVQVAHAVEPKFLQKPLGDSTDRTLATYVPSKNHLENWEQSLLSSTSFSQVFLHYSTLDSCIMWSRSTLLARCRICRGQKDSENMLLCDSCNLGHHLYCLKPKLTSIPKGDWFCDRCTAAKEKENARTGAEVMPKKKRRLFVEEAEEDIAVENGKQEVEEEQEEECSEEEGEEESEDDDGSALKLEVCEACNSGGVLIKCDSCSTSYHKECADPPIKRSKAKWVCSDCKDTPKEETENKEVKDNNNRNSRSKRSKRDSKRRDESDDSESGESHHNHSNRKRSFRREKGRDDLPLHNAALQDLLTEVMKHPDAWPFLRPVQKNEVPDYYDVISHPMDFGNIKYKLNMGEYSTDSQLMCDVALVFENCTTYNEVNSEIYRCGERLLDFFRNKCSSLGLKIPSKDDNEDESNTKRRKK